MNILLESDGASFVRLTDAQAITRTDFKGTLADWVKPGDDPYYDWTFPELGPARTYSKGDRLRGVILTIGVRRYRVNMEHNYATGATVAFTETDEPETPFELLPPDDKHSSYFCGQPRFLQSRTLPTYLDRAAFVLAVIESGWGDCGNEIVWVALDLDKRPARILHEADCA